MVLFSNELSIKCEVTNHCHSLSTPLLGYIFSAQKNIRSNNSNRRNDEYATTMETFKTSPWNLRI